MNAPTKIWTCAAYLPVYRCGGWASVRVSQGEVSGVAGGERHSTPIRCALAGLAAGLCESPVGGGTIEVHAASPELAQVAGIIAGLGGQASTPGPEDDLDLWTQILAAAKGRRLTLIRAPIERRAPTAFVAAWADLARDKAKASGAFTAVIPKPNLAKIAGLASA